VPSELRDLQSDYREAAAVACQAVALSHLPQVLAAYWREHRDACDLELTVRGAKVYTDGVDGIPFDDWGLIVEVVRDALRPTNGAVIAVNQNGAHLVSGADGPP
jgi:hypothetical protein